MKKGDILLLLLLVFGILLSALTKNEPSVTIWNGVTSQKIGKDLIAVIKKNNEIVKTINLSKLKQREVFDISGFNSAEIVAEYNRICFMESSCPDKICVKTGWLESPGETLVCMENRILIKIEQQ